MTVTTSPLPENLASAMIAAKVWTPDCPVPLQRLSLLSTITYVDLVGVEHTDGEIVVLDVVAPQVARIFDSLYTQRFPITNLRSMHYYQASDELSMEANNSSCFCHRPIEGSAVPSMHSYGLAIDINPLQNPFISFEPGAEDHPSVKPKDGWQFINRHNQKPGMVESIVPLMANNGFFRWGGRWTTPIDFHHFEVPHAIGELLITMTNADGRRFFDALTEHLVVSQPNFVFAANLFDPLCKHYNENPVAFFDELPAMLTQLTHNTA